jgi:hypothetical protein
VLSGREALAGTSFALTAGGKEAGGFAALWGASAMSRFDGRTGGLDGEVVTGLLGADWAVERWTAGLAVGHTRGTGRYLGPAGAGAVEAMLNGIYPHVGTDLSERLSAWAAAGWGGGELTVRPEGGRPLRADLSLVLGAAARQGAGAGGRRGSRAGAQDGRAHRANGLGRGRCHLGQSGGVAGRDLDAARRGGGVAPLHARVGG